MKIRGSALVVLDHNRPVLQICNKKIPALNSRFVATNVDKWSIFARIAPNFDHDEARRGTSKLVRFCKTLVDRDKINRVLGFIH